LIFKKLLTIGFLPFALDLYVLTNTVKDVFILIFVDDFQFTSPNTATIKALIKRISSEFKVTDLGNTVTYLGL